MIGLQRDAARMDRMRVAFAFGRPDVDAFLEELTVDELQEWFAFLTLNPQGWDAINNAAARVAWAVLQSRSEKPVDERKLLMQFRVSDPEREAAARRVRQEQEATRAAVRAELQAAAKRKAG